MISKQITRKESIQKVGSDLFRRKGFVGTSMQDIANEIGIKPASLYNHISSKQDILIDLLMHGAYLFESGMNEIKHSSLSPVEKLEKLISLHVRLSIEHTDLMALMSVEWRHLEGDSKKQYASIRDAYELDFRGILEEAIKAGQLQDIDVDIALFSMLTTLQKFYSWYDKHSDLNSLDLEKYLIQCLLGGLRQ